MQMQPGVSRIRGCSRTKSIQPPIASPAQPVCVGACSTSYVSMCRRSWIVQAAGKLDSVGLFADSSLLGGPIAEDDSKGKTKIDEVVLVSEVRL